MWHLQPTYLSGFLKIQLPWGPSISYIFTKLFLTSFLQIRIINCPSIFDPFSPERWWRYLWTASYCVREYRVVVQPTFYTTYVRSGKYGPFHKGILSSRTSKYYRYRTGAHCSIDKNVWENLSIMATLLRNWLKSSNFGTSLFRSSVKIHFSDKLKYLSKIQKFLLKLQWDPPYLISILLP